MSRCFSCHNAIFKITGQWLITVPHFILLLGDFDTLCGVDVYVDVDVDVIYKYLCPVCLLSPHKQEGTLLLIITYMLYPSCFCKIWALCVLWIYLNLPNLSISLISKRRSSIGETLIKIKLKVKWMIKVLKTRNFSNSPSTCILSLAQLSSWKRFGYIWFLHLLLLF